MRQYMMAVAAAAVIAAGARADGDTVATPESEVRFPIRTEITVGYRPVRLVLTGTAMRKAHGINVYAVASYIQEGSPAKTAEQIVAADVVRRYRATGKRAVGREVPLVRDGSSAAGSPEPPTADESPSGAAVRHEDELHLAAALGQLSPDHQEVIRLRNLQRLPFDEVAERMNRSRPAAQMLWMRAIQKLQEAMGQ